MLDLIILGMALDTNNNIYVSDSSNNRVRFIDTVTGTVSTAAGSGTAGSTDGTGQVALFNSPKGLTVSVDGYIYVGADNKIRRMSPFYPNIMSINGSVNINTAPDFRYALNVKGNINTNGGNISFIKDQSDNLNGAPMDGIGYYNEKLPGYTYGFPLKFGGFYGTVFSSGNGGSVTYPYTMVLKDGNVGIGTKSPAYPLQVDSATISEALVVKADGSTTVYGGFHSQRGISCAGTVGICGNGASETFTVGKVTANTVTTIYGNTTVNGTLTATGTVTGGNFTTATTITATGAITGGSFTTAGSITATGAITGGSFVATVNGNISVTGTGKFVGPLNGKADTAGTADIANTYSATSAINTTGAITGGSITAKAGGNISVSGTGKFSGNGSELTDVKAASYSATAGIETTGTIKAGTLSATSWSGLPDSSIAGINSAGRIGINGASNIDHRLYVTGSIYASDNITAYSDVRAKENIVTIDSPLDKIMKMRGVYYTRKDIPGPRQVGVIAQEVEEVLPEVVMTETTEEKKKSVAYGNIVALLIEGIKEQHKHIEAQQSTINYLLTRV